ncbi:hypothetical protein GC163_22785 [bacterium]|nr:hypothetical protein [bacterium]
MPDPADAEQLLADLPTMKHSDLMIRWLFAGLFAWTLCDQRAVDAAEVFIEAHTLQGDTIRGRMGQCTEKQLEIIGESTQSVALSDLLLLDFPSHEVRYAAGDYVVLNNADRFAITQPRIVEDVLVANWTRALLRPQLKIPLEWVSGLTLDLPPARQVIAPRLAELSQTARGHDVIAFATGDQVTGEFQQWDAGLFEMETSLGLTKIDRRRVKSVRLDAHLAEPLEAPEEHAIVWLTDGSRCTVKQWQPKDAVSLQFSLLIGGVLNVGWHEVSRIEVFTPQIVRLSTRMPVKVAYRSYLPSGPVVSTSINQTLTGEPLTLRGREYASGFGVRPWSELTFEVQPDDVAFQTWIGVDDAALGAGLADFAILLDEEVVWSRTDVTGREAPIKTPAITLAGHTTFTLRVDYGARGDIGDVLGWYSPTILRSQR